MCDVEMMDWGAGGLGLVEVGFFVGIAIVLGVVVGLWLDSKLDTRPSLVIAGLLLGIVVAFYGVYRMLLPLMGNKREKGDS